MATYDWRLPIAPPDGANDGTLALPGVDFPAYQSIGQSFRYGVQYLDYWLKEAKENWSAINPGQAFSVDIIAHSMGGLVTRALLQSSYAQSAVWAGDIHDVVMIGTPNTGAVLAFQWLAPKLGLQAAFDDAAALLSPEDLTLTSEMKLALDAAEASGLVGKLVGDLSPSIYDLLPTDQSFVSGLTPNLSPYQNPILADLNANTSGLFQAIDGTLFDDYGTNKQTTATVHYWPLNIVTTGSATAGDGTVLQSSALLAGATEVPFQNVGHVALPGEPAVISTVLGEQLGLPLPADFTPAQRTALRTAAGYILGWLDPVDFSVTDSAARQLGSSAANGYSNTVPGAAYSGDGDIEYFAIPVDDRTGAVQITLGGGDAGSYQGEIIYSGENGAVSQPLSGYVDYGQTDQIPIAPPGPALSIADAASPEGNSGTINMQFVVSLSAPLEQDVTVSYDTADQTAAAGSDYQFTSGVLTIAAGTTSGIISVPIIGDTLPESDETFTVSLHNATNASIGGAVAVGTILNDDPGPDLVGSISLAGRAISAGGIKTKASVAIVNQGTASAAGNLGVSLYLSSDGTIDSSDTLLAPPRPKRIKLKPGAAKKLSVSFVYPDMADGTYYVLAQIDPGNAIAEIDESNNLASSAALQGVFPLRHMTAKVLGSMPRAVTAGTLGLAELAITNNGPILSSRSLAVQLFLSSEPNLDSNSYFVITIPEKKMKINPGATKVIRVKFRYPDVPSGEYYLITGAE